MRSLATLAMVRAAETLNRLIATNTPTPRGSKGRVGEHALEPTGFLEDQGPAARRMHDDPTQAHRIHVAGLIQRRDRVQTVTINVGGMVEKAHSGTTIPGQHLPVLAV